MRKRKGWVSNSSSSSFICDVCGDVESGYDACASDFDMRNFACGHTVCNGHGIRSFEDLTDADKKDLVDSMDDCSYELAREMFNDSYWSITEEQKEIVNKAMKEKFSTRTKEYYDEIVTEEYIDEFDEAPGQLCPVCNLESISSDIVLAYVLNDSDKNIAKLEAEIKEKFRTLDDVKDFLKEDK